MKNKSNIFRATHMSNTLRLVAILCVLLVVGAGAMLLSVPSVRQEMMGWFGNGGEVVSRKEAPTQAQQEAGLYDAAVVNSNKKVRPLSMEDHLWGNISAPVQLIVYEDFECPFCLMFYDTIAHAKAEFGNDLVVAIRHFPLTNHPNAMNAAIASECAAKENKFFDMYNELFNEAKVGALNDESIRQAGKKIGLDDAAYTACLTKAEPEAKITAQKDEVRALGVGGTPANFINGDYYAGALPYDDFTYPDGTEAKGLRSLIQEKLGQKK